LRTGSSTYSIAVCASRQEEAAASVRLGVRRTNDARI
jgi:hypothetical protein